MGTFARFFPKKLGLPTADLGKLKNCVKFERKTADAISMFTTISMVGTLMGFICCHLH